MSKFKVPKNCPYMLGAGVLIEPITTEQKTTAGLIVATTEATAAKYGYVVAVGPEAKRKVIDPKTKKERFLEPGDIVIYNTYANLTITHDSITYLTMTELDIYCVINENDLVLESPIKKRKRDFDGHDGIKL